MKDDQPQPAKKRKPLSAETRKRISDAQIEKWKQFKLKKIEDKKKKEAEPPPPIVEPNTYLQPKKVTNHTVVRVIPPDKK